MARGGKSKAKRRVDIVGSAQTGFVTNPTVKVIWNGQPIGTLKSLGGRFSFKIKSGGELRLKAGWRSANVTVSGSVDTRIQLEWDRTWGKLVANKQERVSRDQEY